MGCQPEQQGRFYKGSRAKVGYDGCIWAVGISSVGLTEAAYARITGGADRFVLESADINRLGAWAARRPHRHRN